MSISDKAAAVGIVAALTFAGTGIQADSGPATTTDSRACQAISDAVSAEVEARPNRDAAIEGLGLTLTDAMVVPDALYQRLARDIEAIKARNADLAAIDHRHEFDPTSLLVEAADEATMEAIRDGDYNAWDCMESDHGQSRVHHMFGNHFEVRFDRAYDMRQLGELYTRLPGIVHTNLNLNVGDGSTITVERSGQTHTYRFARKWGDCPSGCINSLIWEYRVGPDGAVEQLSEPDKDAPAPAR
jgi:hypothetical protein